MYLCSIHCVTLHLLNMLPRLIHVIACSCNSFIFIAGKSYKYTTTNVSHLLMIIWVVSILLNTNKCYAHSYSYIRCTHTEVLLWYISQSLEFLSHTVRIFSTLLCIFQSWFTNSHSCQHCMSIPNALLSFQYLVLPAFRVVPQFGFIFHSLDYW